MVQAPDLRILFVCLGNICRSPTAEGVAAKVLAAHGLAGRVMVDSAGTHGYHLGSAPDVRAQAAAARRGIDLSGLRARDVEPADLQRFDLLLAMDESNLADLKALARHHEGRAEIHRLLDYADGGEVPDPFFGAGDGFEHVLDVIEAGCNGLVNAIEAGEIARRRSMH